MNTKRLGKLQKHALDFAQKYPGWHLFNTHDRGVTKRVILSLAKRGLVEVNQYNQFRAGASQ